MLKCISRLFKSRENQGLGYYDFSDIYVKLSSLPRRLQKGRLAISEVVVKGGYQRSFFQQMRDVTASDIDKTRN